MNKVNQYVNLVSIVAGGAGFIGSNLCEYLLSEGRTVVVIDNFSIGNAKYWTRIASSAKIHLIEGDLSNRGFAQVAFEKALCIGFVDEVWHLAANSDISTGVSNIDVDLKDTFLTTVEILRCMKAASISKLYFASSSAIYGDLDDQPLYESIGPLLPISNYGAMKLASEAIISAATESHLDRACLFRFPNVVGVPATHGVILDFVRKLKLNSAYLDVLGDGTQRKAYLHVNDLIVSMLFVRSCSEGLKILPINVGPIDEGVSVSWIAHEVVKRVAPAADIRFGIENRGWVGDVPKFHYSTEKIQAMGWKPTLGSHAAIVKAIHEIAIQEGF